MIDSLWKQKKEKDWSLRNNMTEKEDSDKVSVDTNVETEVKEQEGKVSVNPEPIYVTLNADQEVTELESLCMNCYKQGITRLMFLKVCFLF